MEAAKMIEIETKKALVKSIQHFLVQLPPEDTHSKETDNLFHSDNVIALSLLLKTAKYSIEIREAFYSDP